VGSCAQGVVDALADVLASLGPGVDDDAAITVFTATVREGPGG
jgi:hypothetical protein